MTNKLRIGIVCYPTYGGSGVIATELGIALSEEGHEVHFISYDHLHWYSDLHSFQYLSQDKYKL